jgi:hypothetical protein
MSLCDHKEFQNANVHTDFIPMHREELFSQSRNLIDEQAVCSAICSILSSEMFDANELADKIDPFIKESSVNFWPNSHNTRSISVVFINGNKKTGSRLLQICKKKAKIKIFSNPKKREKIGSRNQNLKKNIKFKEA